MSAWEVRTDPADPNAHDVWQGSVRIAKLPWCCMKEARLIAAAPDLLLCLRGILVLPAMTALEREDCVKAARAAIAKAEGRS